MAIKSSFASVNLDVTAGADRQSAEPEPDTPFRILLLGDFRGRADQPAKSTANWKPLAVDRDNFEEVLARLQPGFASLRFRELDDFHPDRIYTGSKHFQPLREVRRNLEDPSIFAEAAAEIRAWVGKQIPPAATVQTSPAVEPHQRARLDIPPGGNLLDAIMDAAEPKPAASVARRDELRSFVEKVVAPHQVAAENPELPRLRELVDAESGARMRAILHHPAFQALEAAWRGVFHLVREIETGEQLKVYLLDISKAELAADLSSAGDLQETAIWRTLVEETVGSGGDAWSVVAGNYSFTQTAEDARMLGRLARIMSFAGAPFLAEVDPGKSEMESEEAARQWETLRQSPNASWIGLAMPRFLLRLPYGKQTSVVESFDFEEIPGTPAHQQYLWGNPAFACVQLLAQAFADDGWKMRPGTHAEIDGLPLHVYETEGETQLKPCAEVLLTDRDIAWVLDQGYMPVASIRDRDAVRLVRFQSIAKPLARLSGPWS